MQKQNIYKQLKKDIQEDSIKFAISLKTASELACDKYTMGLIAFYYVLQKHDEKIDPMIDCLLKEYQENIATNHYAKDENSYPDTITQEYVGILIEIGLSIVDKYPLKALRVFHLINDTYERAGVLPHEILELSVEIVCRVSDDNIKKALELVDIIDVEDFKIEALQRIKNKIDDSLLLRKIKDIIIQMKRKNNEK